MLDEQAALERMREAAVLMVSGVERALPEWAGREAGRILDAWGGLDGPRRAATLERAVAAGEAAARRVAAELRELLALDPEEQSSTPLAVVRTAVREPTAVLAEVGVPEIVRDEFEERAWPDDSYGLVPRTMRDLDEDLAAVHFAWGMAKADVIRVRRPGLVRGGGGGGAGGGGSAGAPPERR